jgi:hypothetical protein
MSVIVSELQSYALVKYFYELQHVCTTYTFGPVIIIYRQISSPDHWTEDGNGSSTVSGSR